MKLFKISFTALLAVFAISFLSSCSSEQWNRSSEQNKSDGEQIAEKLASGDYLGAYAICDKQRSGSDEKRELNERILKNEIANLIGESEGVSALPKIIFAIKERSNKSVSTEYSSHAVYHGIDYYYSDFDSERYAFELAEHDMFTYAIDLAEAEENEELAAKLKKAKPEFKEQKRKKH